LLERVPLYCCCVISSAGFPSSKNYTNRLCEKLIYHTTSATRGKNQSNVKRLTLVLNNVHRGECALCVLVSLKELTHNRRTSLRSPTSDPVYFRVVTSHTQAHIEIPTNIKPCTKR
jgi:hypothetical protein